jgi:hypothetical protein
MGLNRLNVDNVAILQWITVSISSTRLGAAQLTSSMSSEVTEEGILTLRESDKM